MRIAAIAVAALIVTACAGSASRPAQDQAGEADGFPQDEGKDRGFGSTCSSRPGD